MQEIHSQSTADRQTFSTQPTSFRKKSGKKWVVILVLVIVLGTAAYFLLRSPQKVQEDQAFPEPAPFAESQDQPTPTPTPTPEPVARSEISIKVLNGTGIAREAAYLRDKLQALGYSEIEVGNTEGAAREATEVAFATDVAQSARNEILSLLEENYSEVKQASAPSDTDVRIVTGLRPGQTLPTPTPTSQPTPTVTVSPSPTPSPTPTPTP